MLLLCIMKIWLILEENEHMEGAAVLAPKLSCT